MSKQHLIQLAANTEAQCDSYNHRVVFSKAFEPPRWAYVATEREARQLAQTARNLGYRARPEYKRVDERW